MRRSGRVSPVAPPPPTFSSSKKILAARVLAEHQRLYRHRHRARGHADATEVDIVEIAQRDAVEHQQLGADRPILLHDATHGLRYVTVEDQVDRAAAADGALERERHGARERGDALVRRLAAPAEGEREFGVALFYIEAFEMLADDA